MPLLGLGRRRPGLPGNLVAAANALAAAGIKVNRQDADTMRRLIMPWQNRAFAYYDLLGEIKYASQFYSRSLSSLRLYPGYIDDKGDVVEVTGDERRGSADDVAIAALARVRDPGGGGRTNLLGAYGRLQFLAGECYLFVSEDSETKLEQWEMLSTDELRVTGSGYTRYKAPSMSAEEYQEPTDDDFKPIDDTAVAYRLWKRHPRYSMWPDSTMQGVLDLCEELVLLTQAVRSRARSRLAGAGFLLFPDEVSFPALEPAPDEDPAEDQFQAEMIEAMMAPITNEGAASAVVPLLVRMPGDYIEKVRHLQIVDPTQLYPETGLRRECIERIAIGLDLPAEILTGLTDVNHWSAWAVDEQTWKNHLQPISDQLVGDLTGAYYQPELRAENVTDWDRYVIAYDASAIINHPDRTKDAKDLHDRGVLGAAALLEAAGFAEDDAQTEQEHNEFLGIKMRDSSLAVYGIPSLRGQSELEPAAGEIEGPTGTEDAPAPNAVEPGPPENGPPETTDEEPTPGAVVGGANGNGHAAELLAARVLGACDLTLHRAREQAGNRLRTRARRDPETARLIDGVHARNVASVLGAERVKALGADPAQLVKGAADMLQEAFRMWGVKDAAVAELLGDKLETHAARTLFEDRPPPLPRAFAAYALGALER